ncbi:hypothetical protein M758_10G161600 [Ceratodon purpureus]|nr:hypothetical protein M758_10G161600 [Ceratodon purpureus]
MGGLSHLPDGGFGNPRYNYRHRSLVPRNKLEDDVSPKSVITGIRFISPASSSSSSMDHRPLSDHTKLHQPHHDRGYSISDGEASDPDTLLESSREFNKVCAISRSLETLPETHSLTLNSIETKGERSYNESALLQDRHQIQQSKRSHQKTTSNGDALGQDIMSISSTEYFTGSESSRMNTQGGVSSQDTPLQNRRIEENRVTSTVHSPQHEVTNPFENPGTPLRFFSSWQSQLGSPVGSHIGHGSPGFDKGIIGSFSPANLTDHLSRGIPFQHRFLSGPLHGGISPRPTPSKWDDAEKWIVSPGHHESSTPPKEQRPQQPFQIGRRHSISEHCHRPNFTGGSPEFSTQHTDEKPLSPMFEHMAGNVESLNRSASQKRRSKALSFGDLSKRVFDISCSNTSQTTNCLPRLDGNATAIEKSFENTGAESNEVQDLDARQESNDHVPSTQPRECGIAELLEDDNSWKIPENARCLDNSNMDMEILKHALIEPTKEIDSHQSSCPAEPPAWSGHSLRFERRKSSSKSQQNSSCTTPTFSASPARHNTPAACSGRRPASLGSFARAGLLELQTWHLEKLKLCKLSSDDKNMAWSTREEEDMECSVSLRDHDSGVLEKGCLDDQAASWEGAEQTKLNERYDEEDARIDAWEELQTSRAEAEMQKTEMKIEKMRARALEKMTNRIALARKKAKEMRAAANTRRTNLAAKTTQQVEQIYIASHVLTPTLKSPLKCCFQA